MTEQFDKQTSVSVAEGDGPGVWENERSLADGVQADRVQADDGQQSRAATQASRQAPDGKHKPELDEVQPDADETTGASPGTAQACEDLGLSSLSANLARFNIKPPGVA